MDEINCVDDILLPDFVVEDVNNPAATKKSTIRMRASPISFPLSDKDRKDIYFLILKYHREINIAGLAAPQIGISKRVIVFDVPDISKEQEPFPITIWINPSFEKVNDEVELGYEECFSVKNRAGPVARWKSVNYKAYHLDGQLVEGVAEGEAARVIQHETEHLDGILFIDHVPEGYLMTTKEYNEAIH